MRDKSLTDLEHKFLTRTTEDDSFPRFKSVIAEAGFPAWLAQHDPSQNRKYVRWIAKRYIDGSIKRLEDIPSTINSALTTHMRLSQKRILPVECRNIEQFKTPNDLMDLLDQYRDADLGSRSEVKDKEEQLFFDTGEAVLIYDDQEYKIVVPKTETASKYFGRNTRWCTAAEKNNAFDAYVAEGDLYIILHKPTNRRWQLHFAGLQFMDEMDEAVDYWKFCEDHKAVVNALQPVAKTLKSPVFNDKISDEDVLELIEKVNAPVINFIKEPSELFYLASVRQNPLYLRYIPNPSEDVCLAAVRQDGRSIQYIDNPSHKVCIAAVEEDGSAIQYIKDPTDEICLLAISKSADAIYKIRQPSEAVCLAAVERDGLLIRYIKNPTHAVCMAAVKKDGFAIQYIKNPSEDLCLAALQECGMAIDVMPIQSEDLCLLAVKNDPNAIFFIRNPSEEACLIAAKKDPATLRYALNLYPDLMTRFCTENNGTHTISL